MCLAVSAASCIGDGRVSARSGMIATDEPHGDANFTVDLPDGWESAEWLPNGRTEPVRGSFFFEGRPIIYWILGDVLAGGGDRFEEALSSDTHESWTEDIVDSPVTLVRIKDVNQLASIGVAGKFDSIPGAPEGTEASLYVYSPSVHYKEYEGIADKILEIVRSVRHSDLPKDQRPMFEGAAVPEPAGRVEALPLGEFRVNFSALVPEGWKATGGPGLDSISGHIRGDGIDIGYEFFDADSTMGRDPYDSIMSPDEFPEHIFWEETIEGEPFYFYAPSPGSSGEGACVGAHIPQLPGSPYQPGSYIAALGIFACDLTDAQKATAIAMIRSVRWAGDGA